MNLNVKWYFLGNGQRTEQVKTGQVNSDRPLVGPSVDTFVGCFVGAFVGSPRRAENREINPRGWLVWALVGALVGGLVGQISLSPALSVTNKRTRQKFPIEIFGVKICSGRNFRADLFPYVSFFFCGCRLFWLLLLAHEICYCIRRVSP